MKELPYEPRYSYSCKNCGKIIESDKELEMTENLPICSEKCTKEIMIRNNIPKEIAWDILRCCMHWYEGADPVYYGFDRELSEQGKIMADSLYIRVEKMIPHWIENGKLKRDPTEDKVGMWNLLRYKTCPICHLENAFVIKEEKNICRRCNFQQ